MCAIQLPNYNFCKEPSVADVMRINIIIHLTKGN